MSFIEDYIVKKNNLNEKILSVFLTAGYPDKRNFSELAVNILKAGADMLEVGFPFSDPLADGPVIQYSSQKALESGINIEKTFKYVSEIRKATEKPLIMMGYANPVLSYGINNFTKSANEAGVNGVIIPDVPIEEYEQFFDDSFKGIDTVLLITPTTPRERIAIIDQKGSGFVYCVSVSGTTGTSGNSSEGTIEFLKYAYGSVKRNKMLVGFGISGPEAAKNFAPYCDGVIVGTAIIRSLKNDKYPYNKTLQLIMDLKSALLK